MTADRDELKGYKGRARAKLQELGARVWSEVRLINDSGSIFEGVVLPRSETLDDEHIVIKMKNGYNIGVHVSRVASL
jgi:glutamyl-tRNA(Gln) amidotransferase subunit D